MPPTLRLVQGGSPAAGVTPENSGRRIAQENRSAAKLDARDARWVLAIRVGQAIEGGRQAMLSPEKRRRLIREGQHLGLRDFDTNLIIAIVQDGARTGEGLGYNVEQRLSMIRAPGRERDARQVMLLVAMSLGIAGLWLMIMVRWLGG